MASSKEISQLNSVEKGFIAVDASINKTTASYLTLVKTIEDGNKTINQNKISFEGLKEAQKKTKESGEQLDKLDKVTLRKELKEYGAWDIVELSNHNDNLMRWLWISCGDIAENN